MTCRKAELLMQQSLDAPLLPAQRARLDAHWETCPACRQAMQDGRRLSRAADEWVRNPGPPTLAPAEFTARVMAQVAAQKPAANFGRAAFALAAAGLTALCALSLLIAPLLLPPLPSWKPLWDGAASASGLWDEAQALLPVHWAALLLPPALAANALLALAARRRA